MAIFNTYNNLTLSTSFVPTMTRIGRCFTFNSFAATKRFQSYRPGAKFGLQLRLFAQQQEYFSGINSAAGFRVSVDDEIRINHIMVRRSQGQIMFSNEGCVNWFPFFLSRF